MCVHHSGTHCVPPFIIGLHGGYVPQLNEHAAHCVWFGAIAAMISFVKELKIAKQFPLHNVLNNQVQTSCWHTQCHILTVAYHCVRAMRTTL